MFLPVAIEGGSADRPVLNVAVVKSCVVFTPGLLGEIYARYRSEFTEHKTKSRRTKRMQRDAAAVSIVRGWRRVGSFAERQQLAEERP
jgi:hypothetical protein